MKNMGDGACGAGVSCDDSDDSSGRVSNRDGNRRRSCSNGSVVGDEEKVDGRQGKR